MEIYPPLNIKIINQTSSNSVSSYLTENYDKSCLSSKSFFNKSQSKSFSNISRLDHYDDKFLNKDNFSSNKYDEITRSESNLVASGTNFNKLIRFNKNISLNDIDIQECKQTYILRKLGACEKTFHTKSDLTRCYIYRTFIVSSVLDLYKNINILNQAIKDWKNSHPLLKSRILKRKITESNQDEYYFSYADEDKINNTDNINYLYYKSNCSNNCDDIWKLLVEKEKSLLIPHNEDESSLLWRLSFLQINNIYAENGTSNKKWYVIILTYNHAIMDGRCSYNSILNLLSIIENISDLNYSKPKEYTILPSKEEIFKNRCLQKENILERHYLKAPEFLDIENAFKSSYSRIKYLSEEEEEKGIIYTYDHKPYVTVKQLAEISKNNHSKFRTLLIKKTDFQKILKKCKENNVKLTSFINMTLVLALRFIYFKHGKTDSKKDPINFTTNVSLREYEEFKSVNKNKEAIGCYIGMNFISFTDNFNFRDHNTWIHEFWNYSRQESELSHKKLKNGDYIHSVSLPAKRKEKLEFFYHFSNSNLGVLKSSISAKKLIKVKQTYASSRYIKNHFLCWFTNLLATIDDELCWTISFNSSVIKQELIITIIENLSKIIRELIR